MTAWLLIVRDVGTDHEHEFVTAHARRHSFQWVCPVDVGRADSARSGKETGRSLAWPSCGLGNRGRVPPMYPHGDPQITSLSHPTGGPLPASTILVLECAATAIASLVPQLTSAGYTVTQTTDPDEAFAKIVEHQLAILDVGVLDAPRSPPRPRRNPRTARTGRTRRRPTRRPFRPRPASSCAARSGPRRPWPRCPSCASPTATTSRSGSASWRPAPTTSSPDRSTHARSRRGSRRSSCASSDRSTRRRSSRPTASRSRRPAEWSPSSAPRAASGRRPSRRTSPWRRRSDGPTAWSWSTSTCSSARSRRTSTCPPSRP